MVEFDPPVIRHETEYCRVMTYGRLPQMVDNDAIFGLAIREAEKLGADPKRICVLKPASDATKPGFRSIKTAEFGARNINERQESDGVTLNKPRSAVIIPTGDCPAVFISNLKERKMVAIHAGRPALTPSCDCDTCIGNIISGALVQAGAGVAKEHIRAYITGSISPKHFRHHDENGQRLILPFLKRFGDDIFSGDPAEGRLDMVKLIKAQISDYTAEENIVWDGVCTFSDKRLASHRREGRKYRNITIAVHLPA